MGGDSATRSPLLAAAELAVLCGPQFGERIPLPIAVRAVLGTGPGVDVRLLGEGVAARHCAIERDAERGFVLHDLGAPQGTYCNGRRVAEVELADGDRIGCGAVEVRFTSDATRRDHRTSIELRTPVGAASPEVVEDRPADALVLAGAKALGSLAYVAALPCARARAVDRVCHGVLDACRGALGAKRGAVLRMGPDGTPETLAVRRATGDPTEVPFALAPEWLARVAGERRALLLRDGLRQLVLAPVPRGDAADVLCLGWDLDAPVRAPVPQALAAAAAVGALLGNALERLQAAASTEARDDLARLLVETSDDVLFALDDAGTFTFCNHAPGARAGRARDELTGRRLVDLVPVGDREPLLRLLDRVLEDGERPVLETALQIPGGVHVPVRLELGPLRSASHAVVGVRGQARDLREVQAARAAAAEAAGEHPRGAEALLGDSVGLRAARVAIERAQEHAYPVLVVGETGTGKELVARAIHYGSERQGGRFVAVRCSALPEPLLAAELFGEPGASAGGLVAAAKGGTLFLDGIDDLPLALQGRLLRVLDAGEDPGAAARVVAATHRDLAAMATSGEFRGDLVYRLDVMRIDLPPLRDRLEDLPVLARHALRRVHDESGRDIAIDPAALAALGRYPWPGHVRELFNALRRAALSVTGATIQEEDLGMAMRASAVAPGLAPSGPRPMKQIERDAIVQAIAAADGNRRRAAELLGMPRSTLYRRLRAYGLL